MLKKSLFFIFSIITINTSCGNEKIIDNNKTTNKIIVGAERINEYKSLITAKKIGIAANHTSVIFKSLFMLNLTEVIELLINLESTVPVISE